MKKILLYNSGGGLGDSIQLIPLILSLQSHFDKSEIYYISSHNNHFSDKLKDFRLSLVDLDINIKYFGFRWWHLFAVKNRVKIKFDIIIDLQSKIRNTLILKQLPHFKFYSSTFNFYFCSEKKNYISTDDNVEMTLHNISALIDKKISRKNFNIDYIPRDYLEIAKKILPDNNYIGISLTQGNEYRKKTWPLENFLSLSKKILSQNKKPVFFIESKYSDLIEKIKKEIPSAIFPEKKINNPSPLMVTALSTRLENSVSIDNGVMHMIGLSGAPMIVLFGPTNSLKFAPRHEKIKILDSKLIYKTKDISKITVKDVLDKF